jgi:hypothetical protein
MIFSLPAQLLNLVKKFGCTVSGITTYCFINKNVFAINHCQIAELAN